MEVYKTLFVWEWHPSCDRDVDNLNNLGSRLNWRALDVQRVGADFELFIQAGEGSRDATRLILDEREALLDRMKVLLQEAGREVLF